MNRPTVELISVDPTNRRLLDRFIRVPWFIHRVHHPSPHWVPPLRYERRKFFDPRHNTFFEHAEAALWIARVAGSDVGRIAAVVDHDWQDFHRDETGSFGAFDSPDDTNVAHSLLDAAIMWLRVRGANSVLGPLDLSTNHVTGLLVDGFDSDPFVDMPYNPPYYERLLTSYGFRVEHELWQWTIDVSKPVPARVSRLAAIARARSNVTTRHLRKKQWDQEIELLLDLYNDIWTANWGFVPLRAREMRQIADGLRRVLRPQLAVAAEIDGVTVAFGLVVPNVNTVLKRLNGALLPVGFLRLLWQFRSGANVESGRLMLLGIRRQYRGLGLDAVLCSELHRAVVDLGLKRAEIGWTSENNMQVNRAIEAMNGRRAKSYRVYRRGVGAVS